ncbi:MAG: Fe2+-dependent dioxygenase [Gammaproteobacteria bacterium]|nr:Fe2+-dependent dioxygenase [Gammaproteobacteria bacterium]
MLVSIPDVLSKQQLKSVRELLENADYVDGRLSAGKTARKVKKNHELATDSKLHGQLNNIVMNSLFNHPVYQAAVLPHRLATPFYARYEPGETYGQHVDDPIMGPMQGRYRTDVSTTLFLNEPDEYAGGEIVIQSQSGEQNIKLNAGSAITYPSGSLHKVAEVTQGTRLVAVTWAQSLVRDAEKRELLFNLHKTRETLQKKYPDDDEVVKIDHTYINLMRMWAEI